MGVYPWTVRLLYLYVYLCNQISTCVPSSMTRLGGIW